MLRRRSRSTALPRPFLTRIASPISAIAVALLCSSPTQAHADESSVKGDVLFLSGGLWPQGSTTQFSDAGWDLSVRAAPHLPFIKGVIPVVGLSTTFFPSESGLVEDETENFIVLAKEVTDRWAGSVNVGLQLGSPSRRGFFRPRAAVAPGFYTLIKDTHRTLPEDPDPYYTKSLWLGRLGWKAMVGADFSVSKAVSVAVEYVYDQVWDVEGGQNARYQGFAVGVAVAMESKAFQDESQPGEDPAEPEE